MRCLIAILTLLLTISAAEAQKVKLCILFCVVEQEGAVDSFSTLYERVITSPADSAEVKKLSRPLRERLTRNEVLYRCSTGWKSPLCQK